MPAFWLNGEFGEDPRAISIKDRGFLIGDGVFETILADRGRAAFLTGHTDRLRAGLKRLHINAHLPDELSKIIKILAEKNGFSNTQCVVRITVSRGAGGRGLAISGAEGAQATLLITAGELPPRNGEDITVQISSFIRNEHGVASRCKSLNYLDNILARSEAEAAGCTDALLLNTSGRLACASAANVFLINSDGEISTPGIEEGALPGIVRMQLISAASAAGLEIHERQIGREEIPGSLIFLTNSLIGLKRARLYDDSAAQENLVSIFEKLHSLYDKRLNESLNSGTASR